NDNVIIKKEKGQWLFAGKGSARLECYYRLNMISKSMPNSIDAVNPSTVLSIFNKIDSVGLKGLTLIDSYKDKLADPDYTLMKINWMLGCEGTKSLFLLYHNGSFGLLSQDNPDYIKALKDYKNPMWNENIFNELKENNIASHCL